MQRTPLTKQTEFATINSRWLEPLARRDLRCKNTRCARTMSPTVKNGSDKAASETLPAAASTESWGSEHFASPCRLEGFFELRDAVNPSQVLRVRFHDEVGELVGVPPAEARVNAAARDRLQTMITAMVEVGTRNVIPSGWNKIALTGLISVAGGCPCGTCPAADGTRVSFLGDMEHRSGGVVPALRQNMCFVSSFCPPLFCAYGSFSSFCRPKP